MNEDDEIEAMAAELEWEAMWTMIDHHDTFIDFHQMARNMYEKGWRLPQ